MNLPRVLYPRASLMLQQSRTFVFASCSACKRAISDLRYSFSVLYFSCTVIDQLHKCRVVDIHSNVSAIRALICCRRASFSSLTALNSFRPCLNPASTRANCKHLILLLLNAIAYLLQQHQRSGIIRHHPKSSPKTTS